MPSRRTSRRSCGWQFRRQHDATPSDGSRAAPVGRMAGRPRPMVSERP
jgi:hypothetical protein